MFYLLAALLMLLALGDPAAALLVLLLLLQPTTARAIAAKAAIAGVRLIIFLSLIRIVRLSHSALTDPSRRGRSATAEG